MPIHSLPPANRRLNELIGFLLFVFAVLLVLALVSYSPLDPSLNTAATPLGGRPAHNWIGVVGAYAADLVLQGFGVSAFLVPAFLVMFALSWFRSRPISSPYAKTLGAAALVTFLAGFIGLLPRNIEWKGVIPSEGLLGRIVADALIHYFNVIGAYVISVAAIAVGLYLSTAFSFGAMQIWSKTRLGFAYAALDRFKDWRIERARKKAAKELEKKRAAAANAKPVVTAQLVPKRLVIEEQEPATAEAAGPPVPLPNAAPAKTGIERMFEAEHKGAPPASSIVRSGAERGDRGQLARRCGASWQDDHAAPGRQLQTCLRLRCCIVRTSTAPSMRLNSRTLAQVLAEKCGEFDVRGQVVQINPGPVVTTFEFKPEAGIKYSRITSLCDDLCLALRAESILIERMSGKSTVGIQVPNHERETIWLREVVEAQEFLGSKSKLTLAMGKDINGRIVTADLNAHAAPADRGLDRLRQERRHQRLHHVDSVQGDAAGGAADPGRSQAAGAGQLRRRAAPAHADHHRAQAGVECAAQRGARDGAAAESAGGKRRAQHRSVQQAVRRHDRQPVRRKQRGARRCPTSSSLSTSSPT